MSLRGNLLLRSTHWPQRRDFLFHNSRSSGQELRLADFTVHRAPRASERTPRDRSTFQRCIKCISKIGRPTDSRPQARVATADSVFLIATGCAFPIRSPLPQWPGAALGERHSAAPIECKERCHRDLFRPCRARDNGCARSDYSLMAETSCSSGAVARWP